MASQQAVIALFRQLAETEGINVAAANAPGFQTPSDDIPHWLHKLRAVSR